MTIYIERLSHDTQIFDMVFISSYKAYVCCRARYIYLLWYTTKREPSIDFSRVLHTFSSQSSSQWWSAQLEYICPYAFSLLFGCETITWILASRKDIYDISKRLCVVLSEKQVISRTVVQNKINKEIRQREGDTSNRAVTNFST